jgi:tetratricopeptide (TPR) repeat protein
MAAQVDATALRGLVIENELGGPPMPNVQISAVAGANPTVTHSDGTFKLEFPKKQPGDIVQIVVSKPGYVVVNEVQLRRPLPKDPDSEPLTILLCKEEVREEMARRFYQLKGFEAIERTYERRVAVLKKERKADAEALAKLGAERDQAKAAAEKAAEQLARLKPEQTSQLYEEATRLFLEGKVEEAIDFLDEEKLRRSVAAAKNLKAEAQKAINQAIQGYLLKAQLLATRFHFDEAEKTYRVACESAPRSFDAIFAYAKFCLDSNQHNKALSAYQRCWELARESADEDQKARTLNGLGILHYYQNRIEEARKAYEESLAKYRQLADNNPQTYLPYVANTLNNFGNLHSDQNQMEDAYEAYEEALMIRRRLSEQNPPAHLPYVAMTLNNLGGLHSKQKRMNDALAAYDEALRTFRKLAEENPQTYLPYVAIALNNLAVLHRDQKHTRKAQEMCEEALTKYRQLAENIPQTYLPYVANTLNNLGLIHYDNKRMFEARNAYEEALAIQRQLAEQNPLSYLPDIASTLSNLGILYKDQNRIEDARKAYEEALNIYERFAKPNSERYNGDVSRVRHHLRQLGREKEEPKDR